MTGKIPAALQRIWAEDSFSPNTPEKALVALLRLKTARYFLTQTQGLRKEKKSKQPKLEELSSDAWEAKIDDTFFAVWNNREKFKQVQLGELSHLLNLADRAVQFTPNLWTFAIDTWGTLIRGSETVFSDELLEVLTSNKYQPPEWETVRKNDPLRAMAALWREVELDTTLDSEARQYAHWKRARLLPSPAVDTPAGRTQSARAAKAVSEVAGRLSQLTLIAQARSRAAELWDAAGELESAVDECKNLEGSRLPEAISCLSLVARIQRPEIELKSHRALPLARSTAKFRSRNIEMTYWQLISTTPEELASLSNRYSADGFRYLRYPGSDTMRAILKRRATKSGSIKPKATKKYDWEENELSLPALPAGIYLLAVSSGSGFKSEKDLIEGTLVTISDRALVASIGSTNDQEHPAAITFYPWNSELSEKAEGGHISLFERTDKTSFREKVVVPVAADAGVLHKSNAWTIDALYEDGERTALLDNVIYFGLRPKLETQVFFEIDRKLYRPGQKLLGKIVLVERTTGKSGEGWKLAGAGRKIQLIARDPQGEKWKDTTVTTTSAGMALIDWAVPKGRLLGEYSIEGVHVRGSESIRGTTSFSVQAYRRSQAEIVLKSASAPTFHKPHTVLGTARYYSSQPVARAQIEWKLYRLPSFWMRGGFSSPQKTLLDSGVTSTDARGLFRVTHTPKAENGGKLQRYAVECSLVASDGTTVVHQYAFNVGADEDVLQIVDNGLFYDPSGVSVPLTIKEGKGAAAPLHGYIHIERAELTAPSREAIFDYSWTTFLENSAAWSPRMKPVRKLPIKISGEVKLSLGALDSGIYRLSFGSEKSSSPIGFVMVANEKTEPTALKSQPTLILRDARKYSTGETVKLLLGAPGLKGKAVVEIWAADRLIQSEWIDASQRHFSFKVPADAEGGMTARWFHVRRTEMLSAEVKIPVAYTSKVLAFSGRFPDRQMPGTQTTITLKGPAPKKTGKPSPYFGSLRVVDAALDTLAAPDAHWLNSLYPELLSPGPWAGSLGQVSTVGISAPPVVMVDNSAEAEDTTKRFKPPSFYWQAPSENEFYLGGAAMRMAAPMQGLKEARFAVQAAKTPPPSASVDGDTRTEFSETALFQRDLQWNGGEKSVSFRLPDSLTRWKAQAQIYDSALRFNQTEAEITATKPFTVRLSVPRVFREMDKALISIECGNDTAKAVTADVALSAEFTSADGKHSKLPLKPQKLQVAGSGSKTASWPVQVPKSARELTLVASAVAGQARDSEKRVLDVLPSKFRLVKSTLKTVPEKAGESVELELSLRSKDRAGLETTTLGVFALDSTSLAHALPALRLADSPRSDELAVEVATLGIMRSVFKKFPALKTRLGELPAQKSEWGAWNMEDPRRLTQLEESPWLRQAAGGTDEVRWLSLLPSPKLDEVYDGQLKKLESLQLESGAWAWFAGGEADMNITVAILESLLELKRHGDTSASELTERALRYLAVNLRGRNASDKTSPAVDSLRFARLFLGFGLKDSFTKDWLRTEAARWQALEKSPEEQPVASLSPLERNTVAELFDYMGKTETGALWRERVFEQSKTDPLTGISWPSDEEQWRRHRDSFSEQAALLSSLLRSQPADPRLGALARALHWNQFSHQWRSALSSTQAFSALAAWFSKQPNKFESPVWTALWSGETKQAVREVSAARHEFLWTRKGPSEKTAARVEVKKPAPGIASLTATLIVEDSDSEASEALAMKRKFYLVHRKGEKTEFAELEPGETVPFGAEVFVEFETRASGALEYLHIHAPRGSGFEPAGSESGWKYDSLSHYLEIKDAAENAYIPALESGKLRFGFYWRASLPGTYSIAAATAQSAFMPAISAHSDSFQLKVGQPLKLDQERSTPKSQ